MLWATSAQAQVESLEPNPLEPAGAGSAGVLEFQGSHSGGVHLGRTPRGQADRVDEDPAETTLRDIDGTNYGHRTGHAAPRGSARPTVPRGSARQVAPGSAGRRPSLSPSEREIVYSNRRDGYDRGRYTPRGGDRQRAPHRAPAARATRPRWY